MTDMLDCMSIPPYLIFRVQGIENVVTVTQKFLKKKLKDFIIPKLLLFIGMMTVDCLIEQSCGLKKEAKILVIHFFFKSPC
jgi:hypothetical protein